MPPPAKPDSARDIVHLALTHQAERYPDLDLAPLDSSGLETRDAAFAHAIYDAVLRRWITLGYLVEGYSSRHFADLNPRLRAVLLSGAAQLLLLDKVPPHAALNESVDWAKRNVKPEAGGLVNAILRRIAALIYGDQPGLPESQQRQPWTRARNELPIADGTALRLRELVLPDQLPARIAIATSHPLTLIEKWISAWGKEPAFQVAAHNLTNPPTILNTRFATGPIPASIPHQREGSHVYKGSREDLITLLSQRQDIWVQDSSSALAVQSIDGLQPNNILDLCAGQGTKTRQLAATFPTAQVTASDTDPRRLSELRAMAARNPRIKVLDAAAVRSTSALRAPHSAPPYDLILLDVPCSNSGVLPRRVEARYRCDRQQLERLTALQREIIQDATRLLAPQGRILYSTCSLEPEENEHQLAFAQTLGLTASSQTRTMPTAQPGDSPTTYSDGAFSALLSLT